MTNLERTLVDIVVRPQYSGGPRALLKAYRSATGRADVATVAQMLQRLEFVYPYHQAVGFLMKKAGFQRSQLEIFKEPGLQFNFYLAHGMPEKVYDSEWKLFYPADLESR
jgi:predicted transcriptional regulator of viral defense system